MVSIHVGELIKAEFDRHPRGHTVNWFAQRLNCKRGNIYDIFNRKSVDTELLMRICAVLGHDFFREISDMLCDNSIQRVKESGTP